MKCDAKLLNHLLITFEKGQILRSGYDEDFSDSG